MKILTENNQIATADEINKMLEAAQQLLSLGSGVGFRQISGINVFTNIRAAEDAITKIAEYLNADDFENDVQKSNFQRHQDKLVQGYFQASRDAINELVLCCSKLREGALMASKALDEIEKSYDNLR